jgi:hypothetical protein
MHQLLHLSSLAETQGHLSVPNLVATQANVQKATIFRLRFTGEDGWEAEARVLNSCPCVLITDTEHVNKIKLCMLLVLSFLFVDAHDTAISRDE